MPAVSQQGSRAGLITYAVISTILMVTAIVMAIYYNAEMRRVTDALATEKARYTDVIGDVTVLGSDKVKQLQTDRTQAGPFQVNKSMKLLDVALTQRDYLANVITGSAVAPVDAVARAAATLGEVEKKVKDLGVSIPSPSVNMIGAVQALADALVKNQATVADLGEKVKAANEQVAAANKQRDEGIAAARKEIEQVRTQTQQELAGANTAVEAKGKQVGEFQTARESEQKAGQESLAKKDVEIQNKNKDIDKLKQEITALRTKLEQRRANVKEPLFRQADGQIVRVPSRATVYINLGQGDQIAPGMTFEVYDKNEGLPKLGDGLSVDTIPVGKASIEVIRVGQTGSECRVINPRKGVSIVEGDVIFNLVYDRNVKYNFVVFGKFDLDQNGQPTSRDADVIKRLISQWGGKTQDQLNPDTDFLVVGREPQVPTYTAEELQDPQLKKKFDDAQKELDAYNEVIRRATELHIPVLNQNRFLYFTGYFDQSKR